MRAFQLEHLLGQFAAEGQDAVGFGLQLHHASGTFNHVGRQRMVGIVVLEPAINGR